MMYESLTSWLHEVITRNQLFLAAALCKHEQMNRKNILVTHPPSLLKKRIMVHPTPCYSYCNSVVFKFILGFTKDFDNVSSHRKYESYGWVNKHVTCEPGVTQMHPSLKKKVYEECLTSMLKDILHS